MRIESIRFELEILSSNFNEFESFNRIQMKIKFFSKKNFDRIAQLFNQTFFDVNAKRIFFNRIRMFCILLL
jgi:predicted enzyme involved in methoxymalonyl-ACP biosynthesis